MEQADLLVPSGRDEQIQGGGRAAWTGTAGLLKVSCRMLLAWCAASFAVPFRARQEDRQHRHDNRMPCNNVPFNTGRDIVCTVANLTLIACAVCPLACISSYHGGNFTDLPTWCRHAGLHCQLYACALLT